MNLEEVRGFFTQRGIPYEERPLEHGTQVRARTEAGECVTVYKTGKAVVGGKSSPLRDELKAWHLGGMYPAAAPTAAPTQITGIVGHSKNVFIVYGHDQAARDGLELMLLKMGLTPIILANLPAQGDTIIEKLEKYLGAHGNVGFACALLTPDDEGHRVGQSKEKQARARQNVILELGMVLARLGRARVAIIYQQDVEKPSDIDGLLYHAFDRKVDEVKLALFKELDAAGYAPDRSAL